MSNLSSDELTVLLIANEGESMMPIGRWEAPVKSLLAKGYLQRNCSPQDPSGNFNQTITDAGRLVINQDEDETARHMIEANNAAVIGKQNAREAVEAIAVQLVDLAELSVKITGDDKAAAVHKWGRLILIRAAELIK